MSTPAPDGLDRNRRILLIDDVPSFHENFRRILSGADPLGRPSFEVDSACQGGEALSKVRSSLATGSPYALAFVDLRTSPGWDGAETIQEIRSPSSPPTTR